jgi:hypothetical protein
MSDYYSARGTFKILKTTAWNITPTETPEKKAEVVDISISMLENFNKNGAQKNTKYTDLASKIKICGSTRTRRL